MRPWQSPSWPEYCFVEHTTPPRTDNDLFSLENIVPGCLRIHYLKKLDLCPGCSEGNQFSLWKASLMITNYLSSVREALLKNQPNYRDMRR